MTMMTVEALRSFLGWCAVFNSVLFTFMFAFTAFMPDLTYRLQTRFYAIKRDDFTLVMYRFLAQYKLLIIFLNLTPYLVLRFML